jgi:condensin complex subunit 1
MARTACVALQKMVPKRAKDDPTPTSAAVEALVGAETLAEINSKLVDLVRGREDDEASQPAQQRWWFPAAEQAINALFVLHPRPEEVSSTLISELLTKCGLTGDAPVSDAVPSVHLARLVFLVGHVAIKMLVFLERCEEQLKAARRDSGQKSAAAAAAGAEKKSKAEEELAVAASQDHQIEMLREAAEQSMLKHARSLLSACGPIVEKVRTPPPSPSPRACCARKTAARTDTCGTVRRSASSPASTATPFSSPPPRSRCASSCASTPSTARTTCVCCSLC